MGGGTLAFCPGPMTASTGCSPPPHRPWFADLVGASAPGGSQTPFRAQPILATRVSG